MSVIDLVLVVVVVASAAGFLAWSMLGRGSRAKPCHNAAAGLDDDAMGSSASAPSTNVVIGGALARGLERAAAKRTP